MLLKPTLLAESASTAQDGANEGQQAPIRSAAIGQAPYAAPLCREHQEPCVKKRVNKSGPNKGKHIH